MNLSSAVYLEFQYFVKFLIALSIIIYCNV